MYAVVDLKELRHSLCIVALFLAHLLDLGVSARKRICQFLENVSLFDLVSSLVALQHLFQQSRLLLDFAHLFGSLGPVVCLLRVS